MYNQKNISILKDIFFKNMDNADDNGKILTG